MLRAAMSAAAGDEAKVRTFDEVLVKYKAHPGVQRREREAADARRARHEKLNRPAYEAERKRIPEGVALQMKTADVIVDGCGCAWEIAEEIARFPILKFLRATEAQLEAMPILETLQYHLDRKMPEQQARAVLYALPAKFKNDKKQSALAGGKGCRTAQECSKLCAFPAIVRAFPLIPLCAFPQVSRGVARDPTPDL